LATTERLATMRAAAERGTILTARLLAFARRQPLSPRAVDLNAAIEGMQGLLHSALGPRMQIEIRLAPDLWIAMIDPTQFELVILNLVINARDAMPDGGVITVETANARRGPPRHSEEPAEGDYVVVQVHDTGIGMAPEVQARAFEPFFTTKPPGEGSGLGLSQVFGTARQSGGGVQIASSPGSGTSVSVYLPRAIIEVAPSSVRAADVSGPRTTGALVLVVDDDAAVRTITCDILKDLGYSVLQADGGASALELLDDNHAIDALLTDVVMTGMSGPELAERVQALHPALPIVFISGYTAPPGIPGAGQLSRLIKKPFSPADLRRQIESALAEAREAASPVLAAAGRPAL